MDGVDGVDMSGMAGIDGGGDLYEGYIAHANQVPGPAGVYHGVYQ